MKTENTPDIEEKISSLSSSNFCNKEIKSEEFQSEYLVENQSNDSAERIRKGLAKKFYLNQNSETNESLPQSIKCKIHGKKYLVVDTLNFKISCKLCQEENIEKEKDISHLDISENNENLSSEGEDDIECEVHQQSKGTFYCDDCRIFVCKLCFSKEHRLHNSSLPEDISASFKKKIREMTENVSFLEPKISESIKIISELENKIKNIREISNKRLTDIVGNIKSLCQKKSETFFSEYEKCLENVDSDLNNILLRLNNIMKKVNQNIIEVQNIQEYYKSEKITNSADICVYKKDKKNIFEQAEKLFEDSKYLLNFIIIDTIKNAKLKMNQYNKIIEKFYKEISLYRNSVISSVSTGISSYSFKVRRFTKFCKCGIRYFKNSSVVFKSYSQISLIGFNICGLIANKFKNNSEAAENSKGKSAENNLSKKILNGNDGKSQGINPTGQVNKKGSEKASVPFKLIIKEVIGEDISKNETIFEENFSLTEILNVIDPTITFYLHKSINIKPEKLYVLNVVNLDKEVYLDIWTGEVSKFFQQNLTQTIKCNTTNLKFSFFEPQGLETDFNEFSSGIIADLIYSYKDN